MLMLDVSECPAITTNENGQVVAIIRSAHPVTGEVVDCASFRLSPHHALILGERLRYAAAEVIAPTRPKIDGCLLVGWPAANLVPKT